LTLHPISIGENLCNEKWFALRTTAIFDHCKWDVQCGDHSVLAAFPVFLEPATARDLDGMAEALSREALAAEEEMLRRPELQDLLNLPHAIRKTLRECPYAHSPANELRVMRFDFHYTTEGWLISEVNSDVPGGFIEASGWSALFAREWPDASAPVSPSEIYAHALCEAVGPNGLVALVHATAYSDDRQVMQHLARCLSRLGLRTCLLSPSHLRWIGGRAEICSSFASGCPDAIVRFFPAEWLPNLPRENSWKPYFQESQTALSNPGSAIALQSKRFPLVWDELRTDLSTWRKLLPETRDPSGINASVDDSWVLKPALGRVGEGIGIGGITPPTQFQKIVREARRHPREWVVQRRFDILPLITESGGMYPCIGVFTIGGKAAGFYGRIAKQPIVNQDAQDVAVLVHPNPDRKSS
jgi:glutathionylspermidine synthase